MTDAELAEIRARDANTPMPYVGPPNAVTPLEYWHGAVSDRRALLRYVDELRALLSRSMDETQLRGGF
jgi:hypothetical protein